MEISELLSAYPRPKDLSGSFKAREEIVKLIREWERIDGGDYPRVAEVRDAHPDAVEILTNVGGWSLLPADDGQTTARFRSCNSVGGNIPRWAGEKAARAMLPNNIADLFREAEKRGG